MANLLPMDKAVEQLCHARDQYSAALLLFTLERGPTHKRKAWLALQEAYSRMSSAHWELQQVFAAGGSK